ncbi:interferon alpha-inducible protein 27-like protein 1 isoform X4 [Balaenoptera acutorostrata]|uniref:Interferon alpha-inducible protein 27-like protein 1 isoform X4 n=1 Tax=Balaenoptera acutorostrata TaxID=9767 RepID=A0A384AZP3_BALAC|nr:interferon alpha-inducible protein 27-like protein 1 isoform X4 [Balaenoptera acutorostrata]XP_057395191.1 interferon alpha-inducible protein 27-like protein 1 isoform X4 [Balaenoptera acutorostrata]
MRHAHSLDPGGVLRRSHWLSDSGFRVLRGDAVETQSWDPSRAQTVLLALCWALALAVVAVPTVLGAMGFTGAGIAASSLAAKMMSSAAIANGGGVAAGSLVATLQSVGSAGLSLSSRVLLGSAGFDLVSPVVGL